MLQSIYGVYDLIGAMLHSKEALRPSKAMYPSSGHKAAPPPAGSSTTNPPFVIDMKSLVPLMPEQTSRPSPMRPWRWLNSCSAA